MLHNRSYCCPEWMSRYFDDQGKFDFHIFMSDLLEGIDAAVQKVFEGRTYIKNIGKLSRVTPNQKYPWKKCYKCTLGKWVNLNLKKSQLFVQCESCIVSTSQTKMGACLQLEWKEQRIIPNLFEKLYSCYCSIDLVPAMIIEQIETKLLQQFINSHALSRIHDYH